MSLEIKINEAIKKAMLAKEQERLSALRAVKSAILLQKTSKSGGDLNEEAEISILQKLVKQRKESAEIYTEQNRAELANDELKQAAIIEEFLPEPLSESELKDIISNIIQSIGVTDIKAMGKVMGAVTKEVAGRAENKLIATLVKELLSK